MSRIDAKSRRGNNLIIEFVNDVELFKTSEERTNYIVESEKGIEEQKTLEI